MEKTLELINELKQFKKTYGNLEEYTLSLRTNEWVEDNLDKLKCLFKEGTKLHAIKFPTLVINKHSGLPVEFDGSPSESPDTKTFTILSRYGLDFKDITDENVYIYSIERHEFNGSERFFIRYASYTPEKKKTYSFTITDSVMNSFNELAEELAINKSKFVENALKAFVEKNKK